VKCFSIVPCSRRGSFLSERSHIAIPSVLSNSASSHPRRTAISSHSFSPSTTMKTRRLRLATCIIAVSKAWRKSSVVASYCWYVPPRLFLIFARISAAASSPSPVVVSAVYAFRFAQFQQLVLLWGIYKSHSLASFDHQVLYILSGFLNDLVKFHNGAFPERIQESPHLRRHFA